MEDLRPRVDAAVPCVAEGAMPVRVPRRSSRLSVSVKRARLHQGLVPSSNLLLHMSLFKLQQIHVNSHRGWSASLLRQRQLMAVVTHAMAEISRSQSPAVVAPTCVQVNRSVQTASQVSPTVAIGSSDDVFEESSDGSEKDGCVAIRSSDHSGTRTAADVDGERQRRCELASQTRDRSSSTDSGLDLEYDSRVSSFQNALVRARDLCSRGSPRRQSGGRKRKHSSTGDGDAASAGSAAKRRCAHKTASANTSRTSLDDRGISSTTLGRI